MGSDEGGLYRSRLGRGMDEEALSYLSSLSDDREILLDDLEGTEAHVIMLYEQKIISEDEAAEIVKVLEELREKALRGEVELEGGFEDVHELIEAYAVKRLGVEIGGKLHTGRSRNDQIALDIRLRVRRYLLELWEAGLRLAEAFLSKAREERDTLMPHYTHLQQAQIGYVSQYLLAHLDHLLRDIERIESCYHRVNQSPLGACAIAGSTLPLNRMRVAELLGFEGLIENSVDAVSSRDFALEALSAASIMMVNLSRVAEDLIIWSSSEFDYVELPDELASPSSVMPHKRNPCILELLRAKAGKVIGLHTASLALMKGIPTGYDRDLQEGKPLIWEALRESCRSVRIMAKVIKRIRFKRDKLLESVAKSYAPAIELAEALIKHSGLSLREAHQLVGAFVKRLHESKIPLRSSRLEDLQELAEEVLGRGIRLPEEAFREAVRADRVPRLRLTRGAAHPEEVRRQIEEREKLLKEHSSRLREVLKNLSESRRKFKESLSLLLSRSTA
ncbi:MAG: argininosuccinate lyase [Thaumarchaeota archaeon]|nr:MAG: argininosuccinate lyase [Nitrososphaerota archaeon]